MSTIKDNNFIVIQGWMINDLGLSGKELLIYAILYGMSEGEDLSTQIDIQYLADWTNQNEWLVEQTLVTFERQGLIKRISDNSEFTSYKLTR